MFFRQGGGNKAAPSPGPLPPHAYGFSDSGLPTGSNTGSGKGGGKVRGSTDVGTDVTGGPEIVTTGEATGITGGCAATGAGATAVGC